MIVFCYIDESGHPHQIDEGPYVLAGVTVLHWDVISVENKVRSFVSHWNKKLSINIDEIHTREIIKGEDDWRKVKYDVRNNILMSFAHLIKGLPIYLFAVIVKRKAGVVIHDWRGIRKQAFKVLVERIGMTGRPQIIVLSIDNATLKQNNEVKRDLENAILQARLNPRPRFFISFEDSKKSPTIQIADFFGYLFRSISINQFVYRSIDIEKAFLEISSRIRRCPTTKDFWGCGLKEWIIDK